MNARRLEGKVALVTGGGRGVGRAYALALASEGATVVVNDLADAEGSPAKDVAAEIRATGAHAAADGADVTDADAVSEMMAGAAMRFGRLDIVIANAGIIRPTSIADSAASDWSDVLAVHANGTFNCIRAAAPLLRDAGGGTIVTTGALSTDRHFPRLAAYRSAKAAIGVLTLYAAEEFRDDNINVNSIMPGPTATRMSQRFFESLGDRTDGFPAARTEAAPPDTVPPLGIHLCSDAGRHITGRLFQLMGNTIAVVTPAAQVEFISPSGDAWTDSDIGNQLAAHVESGGAVFAT